MRTLCFFALLSIGQLAAQAQEWVQQPSWTPRAFQTCWFDPAHPGHGVVAGWFMAGWDQNSFGFRTVDGGANLIAMDVAQGGLFLAAEAVVFTSSSTGFLAGTGVLKTYDGGLSWSESLSLGQAQGKLTDLLFSSPDSGYVVGEGWSGPVPVFFKTTDAGMNWTAHDLPVESTSLTCLARPAPGILYAGAHASGLRTLYMSTDDGDSWTALEVYDEILSLSFSSPDSGCAGTTGGILRTTDGGQHWSPVATTEGNVNSLQLMNGSGFAVTSTGFIYRTDTNGLSWSAMTSPVAGTALLAHVYMLSPQRAYAVGGGGTILSYEDLTDLPTSRDDRPQRVNLEPNTPNPFNPVTTVGFTLPAAQEILLEVFDVQGRRVRTLLNGNQAAGGHKVVFDGAGLPSGVYVCCLSGDGVRQSRKMLLIR